MGFSIRRLFAITRKELRHITRDFRIFFLVTLSPAFLLLVLAYLFALDVDDVSLAWLDNDRTATSRSFLAALTADGTFRLTETPNGYDEMETLIVTDRADVVVIVPPGLESNLAAGRQASIQAVVDGTDAISASQVLGNLAGRTAAFGARLLGLPAGDEIRTRIWYNGDLKSLWGMVPGLLAIVLILPALALTLGVSREREVGTLEALIASPVTGPEYQLGKLAAYVVSGLVSGSLAAGVAVFWFGLPFRGDFWLFLLLTVDFYLACMGMSLLIAQFVTSQQTAMLLVLLVFFVPGFFVSGLIQPVSRASLPALLTSYALPSTHFIAISRGIFLKGLNLTQLGEHGILLAVTAVVSLGVSLALFRKRVG